MQREKVDFLVAVGEKLCNMESGSTEMQKLEGLTDASNNVKTERNHRWDDADEDFVQTISQMVSKWMNFPPCFCRSVFVLFFVVFPDIIS